TQQAAHEVVPAEVARHAEAAKATAEDEGQQHEQDRADEERDGRGRQRPDPPAKHGVDRRLQRDHAAHHRREPDGNVLVDHFASSQFLPMPTSTASGGSSAKAAIISRRTISATSPASPSGASKSSSSWICSTSLVRLSRSA